MKKIFILALTILVGFSSFAQRISHVTAQPVAIFNSANANNTLSKVTKAGDTLTLTHLTALDTPTVYKVGTKDSGYVTGPNYWGDKAFAERYDINGSDSAVRILGVYALFAGKVNPTSARTVTFNVWDVSAQQPITGTMFYNGFPANVLDSAMVPVTQLGIGPVVDTTKRFWFAAPTTSLSSSFFVGYNISYNFSALNGDTIALAGTKNGQRRPAGLFTLVYNTSTADTTLDTLVNVQNATLAVDNNWYDNYTQYDSIKNNLSIFPIVYIDHPVGFQGIKRNDFTFFGCFPNPASNSTNIRFSLATAIDVTIQIMDISGRVVNTTERKGLSVGEHTIPMSTSHLPIGDYIFLIRTSSGDGIGSKMSVIR